EELRAIVSSEVDALEALQAEALDELDATERALAEAGLPVEEGAEARRLRHYEAACWRMMRWAQDQLRSPGRRPPSPTPPPSDPPEAPGPPAPVDIRPSRDPLDGP